MKSYIKKVLILIIPVVMLYSILSEYSSIRAEAAFNRSIKIEEVRGTVMIQKNGGVKLIRAYEGMILQQGDRITTNPYSSLRIIVQDTKDEMTIGENAEFFIASLDEAKGNKRTKLTIWNGSIWAKVTPLVNSKDKFEIGTPSSTMNVKGTHFFVGVDPNTGLPSIVVGSGIVNVNPNNQVGGTSTPVYPSQQLVGDGSNQNNGGSPTIVDLDSLIRNMDPAIIAAIIQNKAAIDKENANYILSLQQGQQGQQTNQEDLDRLNQNLKNLIGNIANGALLQNKISKQDMEELIKKLKEQQGLNLDLDKTIPQQLSDLEKDKQAQFKKLEEERKRKTEEEKRKQEQLKQQQQNLANKLEEQRKKLIEQKEKAEKEARQKALEALKRKLDEEAKLALEEKLRELELEKQKQEAAADANVPVPTPPTQPSDDPRPPTINLDKELANAKEKIPASSELYTPESWSKIVLALELGEETSLAKQRKTEAIKSAVAGLVTIIDQNLMDAKSSIPTNSTLYTPDTWERVLAALAMGEANNSEKVEKTEAIRNAVEGLVEIPIVSEIVIVEQSTGANYISISWAPVANSTKYEVYLNGKLVRPYNEIMEEYYYGNDELELGKSYTLEILALDESAKILAKKTIEFQTEAPIEDLVPTP